MDNEIVRCLRELTIVGNDLMNLSPPASATRTTCIAIWIIYTAVNACRSAVLIEARENSAKTGSRPSRRATARSESKRSTELSSIVPSPTRRRTATTASTSRTIGRPSASRRCAA